MLSSSCRATTPSRVGPMAYSGPSRPAGSQRNRLLAVSAPSIGSLQVAMFSRGPLGPRQGCFVSRRSKLWVYIHVGWWQIDWCFPYGCGFVSCARQLFGNCFKHDGLPYC